MEKDNLLFFTIKISSQNTDYYSMLLYALETLHNHTIYKNFDVIVFYDFGDLDINTMNVNNLYIKELFPNISYVEKKWKESINYPSIPKPDYFYKWLCIEYVVHNTNYSHVAYFDCDVIFLRDFNYMFEKYKNFFYGIEEGYDILKKSLIDTYHAMCSGQFIFKRDLLINIPQLFQKITEKSQYLCDNIEILLDNHSSCSWLKTLMEQYAGHRVLLDYNIPTRAMSTDDVKFGIGTCDIDITENFTYIKNSTTNIVHYTNSNAFIFLPKKYRNDKLSYLFDHNISNNKLISRALWS